MTPKNYFESQTKVSCSEGSTDTLKRREEQYMSSCESAKTVCESEISPANITVHSLSEDIEAPMFHFENKEDVTVHKFTHESAIDEVALQRPDHLKGVYSLKKGQSNMTSLGLAFPPATTCWTTIPEKKDSDEWDNLNFSPLFNLAQSRYDSVEERSMEDCIILVCCGLYNLLRGVLLTMPDLMLGDVMDNVVHPDILIVLVNHPSPLIQQGVIKLLDAYFHRASKEQKEKFLRKHGFSLLANQLYLHQGTQGVIECILEMFFGRHFGLDEEFEVDDIKNTSVFRKWCIIPLLGLIENSLYDVTLLHNSFCLLLQILNSCSKVADMLLDNGLLYAFCNTLAALGGIETSVPSEEYILLVCDIQQLLIAVTIHSCSSSGSQYFRIIEDLIILLGYLNESKNQRIQNLAVLLQFKVLQSAIDFIKTTANQDSLSLANSFSFVSTPHHAKYPKRKSIAGVHRLSIAQSDPLLMTMRTVANNELTVMMQRRMSQENPIRASESEFVQRLQKLTLLAVNRLIYRDTSDKRRYSGSQFDIPEEEMQLGLSNVISRFQDEMLKTMIEGIFLVSLYG
ncbi:Hypothetical predicted protein [Pelobates cultripes]|uniref:Uncharacterized protein n=1 Tax=Pelobates cultripes TaxID=61616 RepID=A0AAD1VR54_PELCU|nr:Hypothetical predicted protein [Pelobates cultripes]